MKFDGTRRYVATDDLKVAVNAAITLSRPLLVKGEPGTGKTALALEVADALAAPIIEWHVKSTTKAHQGLYEYDAVSRLRDSQLGDDRVHDIKNYIKRGKLWEAFQMQERAVLLIDEIDKADIEFPNDLLQELDRMEFFVYETGETIKAKNRPIVIITSNNEKELPDAFLRRCFFHYIKFPDAETMQQIVEVHFPGLKGRLVAEAMRIFYEIREVPGLKKKPSTSELLDWIKLLAERGRLARDAARDGQPQVDPAARRRAFEERAGRAPVRAHRLHVAPHERVDCVRRRRETLWSDAVDLHEVSECVPGGVPKQRKDDDKADKERGQPDRHVACDQRGPQKHRSGVEACGPHAGRHRRDGIDILHQQQRRSHAGEGEHHRRKHAPR